MALSTAIWPAMLGRREIALLGTWIAAVVLYVLGGATATTEIALALDSDRTGVVQLFFDMGQGYTEQHARTQPLRAGRNQYRFEVPDGDVRSIRIDPASTTGVTGISALTIQRGGRTVRTIPTTAYVGANQIELAGEDREMIKVRIPDDAFDPQILVRDSEIKSEPRSVDVRAYIFVALLATLCILYAWPRRRIDAAAEPSSINTSPAMTSIEAALKTREFRWGGPLALFALGLMSAMAFVSASDKSVHPDEFSHVTAARYYVDHWLPPRVGDPDSLPSYSVYGASYLNEFDVVYLLAAKFNSVFAPVLGVGDVILYRLFNLLLFLPVIGILFSKGHQRWIAVPLLLTPQAWYIYSYFNADAFALTISLLFAWHVAKVTESGEAIFERRGTEIRYILGIAVLIALVLLSKLNYVPLIYLYVSMLMVCARSIDWRVILPSGCAAVALMWLYFTAGSPRVSSEPDFTQVAAWIFLLLAIVIGATQALRAYRVGDASRRFIPLTLVAIVVGLGLAATRPAFDSYINGSWSARSAKMTTLAEQLAGSSYKPSAQFAPGWESATMHLRRQGVAISDVIFAKRWAAISIDSMFGLYGYMNIIAPNTFYSVLRWCFAVIALIAGMHLFRDRKLRATAIASSVTAVIIVGDSLMTSWIRDFQAQGRYLLPLLCILGMMLYTMSRHVESYKLQASRFVIVAATVLSFAFGAASFLTVALRLIEKG